MGWSSTVPDVASFVEKKKTRPPIAADGYFYQDPHGHNKPMLPGSLEATETQVETTWEDMFSPVFIDFDGWIVQALFCMGRNCRSCWRFML